MMASLCVNYRAPAVVIRRNWRACSGINAWIDSPRERIPFKSGKPAANTRVGSEALAFARGADRTIGAGPVVAVSISIV